MNNELYNIFYFGALGDALGAGLEPLHDKAKHGRLSIYEYAPAIDKISAGEIMPLPSGRIAENTRTELGEVTDDTAMNVMSAYALKLTLEGFNKFGRTRVTAKMFTDNALQNLDKAYRLWGAHQQTYDGLDGAPLLEKLAPDMLNYPDYITPFLHTHGAGSGTISTMLNNDNFGSLDERIRIGKDSFYSLGGGGMMRVAPIGWLAAQMSEPTIDALDLGMRSAAITHGDYVAILSSGVVADLIAQALQGKTADEALEIIRSKLENIDAEKYISDPQAQAEFKAQVQITLDIMQQASAQAVRAEGRPLAATEMQEIGQAANDIFTASNNLEPIHNLFVAPAMLGQVIFLLKRNESEPARGDDISLSINEAIYQPGDSDSVGAILGNILAAFHGEKTRVHDNLKTGLNADFAQQLQASAMDLSAEVNKFKQKNRAIPAEFIL